MKTITLYCKEGTADKVYQVTLEESGTGHVVNFANGRRGGTMRTGTKTSSPVTIDEANKIYDKLIKEKLSGGYKPGEDSVQYQSIASEKEMTGLRPQLLAETREESTFLTDDDIVMQEKHDGERCMISSTGKTVDGTNKKGVKRGLPKNIEAAIPKGLIVDGELVGEIYYVFDLLENGKNLRKNGFIERFKELSKIKFGEGVVVSPVYTGKEKSVKIAELRASGKEGVVFKKADSSYEEGRNDDQTKYKFYETASFKVGVVNAKRSVSIEVLDGKAWVDMGNVTIPANHDIPKANDIVEVRYLYTNRGGAVYQPVYLGKRNDVDESECVVGQLKYKNETMALPTLGITPSTKSHL